MAVCSAYRIRHSEFLSWDPDDREKAITWHVRQAEACPSCGTRPEEWEDNHNAYVAKEYRCRGCEITQQAQASLTEEHGRGVHIVLRKAVKRGAWP
jgi:hypothetical protein